MEESLKMVALDRITGKIDIDRMVSKMSAAQRSSSDTILKVMRDMESEGISTISEEELIRRVEPLGLSKERAEEVIRKLIAEGILFSPKHGKLKRAQSSKSRSIMGLKETNIDELPINKRVIDLL